MANAVLVISPTVTGAVTSKVAVTAAVAGRSPRSQVTVPPASLQEVPGGVHRGTDEANTRWQVIGHEHILGIAGSIVGYRQGIGEGTTWRNRVHTVGLDQRQVGTGIEYADPCCQCCVDVAAIGRQGDTLNTG